MIAPFLLPTFYQYFTNSNDTRMILELEFTYYLIIYELLYFKITLYLWSDLIVLQTKKK